MKNIVFLGTCQARRLEVLYSEKFSPITGDTTDFVGSFEALTPRVHQVLAEADVIVAQVADTEQKVSVSKVETSAHVVYCPFVSGNFLWPHSGRAHLHNQPLPHLHDGPFGVQFGNPWLNAKLKAGAKPDDIIAEYEALDLSKAINLDRTYEMSIQRARERDRRSGDFNLADIIEKSLTEVPLFLTPANFELPLFRPFAKGVYERLGIPSAAVDSALDTLWRTPFPLADHPIHPSIARHFGLKFVGPDTRYRMLTGERLTYREWLSNYVHYRWNDALLEGVYKSSRFRRFDADAQAALDRIEEGLAQSNGSAQGETSKAYLLQLKGDADGTFAAMERAAEFEPENPQTIGSLAFYLADRGKLEEAEQLLRDVTVKWPHYAEGWNRFGSVLHRRGKPAEAAAALEIAVKIAPYDSHIRRHFAAVLLNGGQRERACAILSAGIALMPDQADLVAELSRVFVQAGDLDNALIAARRAAELEPANPARRSQLADILTRRDDPLGAAGAMHDAPPPAAVSEPVPEPTQIDPPHLPAIASPPAEAGAARPPADAGPSSQPTDRAVQDHRQDDGEAEKRTALLADPANAHLRHVLAHGLIERGELQEAETLLAEGISFKPFDEVLHVGLARTLTRLGRFPEAEASVRRAVELKPKSAQIHHSLAEILLAVGKPAEAEQAYNEAIAIDPQHVDVRGSLAMLLQSQGRQEEALTTIEEAILLQRDNPHLLAKQAFILKQRGDLAGARRAAEAAVGLAPHFAGLHGTLADVHERSGDRHAALAAYRAALARDPNNAHFQRQANRLTQLIAATEQPEAAE